MFSKDAQRSKFMACVLNGIRRVDNACSAKRGEMRENFKPKFCCRRAKTGNNQIKFLRNISIIKYADVVLRNEGTPEELFTQTQQALHELKQSMDSRHS